MPKPVPPYGVSLPQFTLVFVAFGLLLIGALMWPELTLELDLDRTKATIWTTTFLLLPALVLYPFQTASQRAANLAHLFWTFAYLMFLVHAYWAVYIIFDGVADTFRQMGRLIAGVNFLLVAWWGLDVVLLWVVPSASPAMARFQWTTRIFTFLVFAITLVALRGGSVRILGFIFVGAVAVALLVRLWARDRTGIGYMRTQ
jgi:hypothetical protein